MYDSLKWLSKKIIYLIYFLKAIKKPATEAGFFIEKNN